LKEFGTIGDFYRPTNLHKLKPSPYAFVRYYYQEDADNAKNYMHGKQYGDRIISVFDANKQDSYFTQDTGKLIFKYIDLLHQQTLLSPLERIYNK
jgi:RNA recognition motif-containing protein